MLRFSILKAPHVHWGVPRGNFDAMSLFLFSANDKWVRFIVNLLKHKQILNRSLPSKVAGDV